MTRKIFAALIITVMLIGSGAVVSAQDGDSDSDVCGPTYIYDSVNAIFAAYQAAASTVQDRDGALAPLSTLREELDKLYAQCGGAPATEPVPASPPDSDVGTRENPYPFGVAGDSGAGFTLRVTGLVRPANRIIREANVVNPVPPDGREYVIVNVELICVEGTEGRCEAEAIDFELTGDQGVIYQNPFVFYDDELDISVFSGTVATGSLVFMIREDDASLDLLYNGSMFAQQDVVAYVAEPSAADGIMVESEVASLNIRNGPGTRFGVTGSLQRGNPTLAFGRNEAGTWLQIAEGWIATYLVTANGDIMILPVTVE